MLEFFLFWYIDTLISQLPIYILEKEILKNNGN